MNNYKTEGTSALKADIIVIEFPRKKRKTSNYKV